MKATANLRKEE